MLRRRRPRCSRRWSRRRSRPACSSCPIPAPTLAPAVAANIAGDRPRQSGHRRADGLSRHGHPARKGRAPARPGRRVVAGARPLLGRRPGPRHQADPLGVLAFLARLLPPVGIVVGIYIFWVGADAPGRRVPGRHDSRRHVAAGHDGGARGCAADAPAMAAAGADRRAGRFPRRRPRGTLAGRRLPRPIPLRTPSR